MFLRAETKAINRKLRTVGVWRTLAMVARHLYQAIFYRTRLIYVADTAATRAFEYAPPEPIIVKEIREVEELSEKDWASVTDYTGEQYTKIINARFARGGVWHLGFVNGALGGAAWVVPDFSDFKTRDLDNTPGSVTIVDCWTIPAHRGKGIYPFLLTHILQKMTTEEPDRVFIEVNEVNHASIRGIEKAGFRSWSR